MKDISTVAHHPAISSITDILMAKTQNQDAPFFRMMTAFFLTKLASNMRAYVATKDRGDIPVNMYACSLAVSGSGKGHSVGILENELMGGFQERFVHEVLPAISDVNLDRLAQRRSNMMNTPLADELAALKKEYSAAGAFAFTFDSGTTAAVKQMRHKLLLSDVGAINLQVDEIGLNLISSTELLTTFLELFDQGRIKQKLTKNTNDNTRNSEIFGKTPANLLLFGTPTKLLDGGKTEEEFHSFLDTGYARRCFFAYGQRVRAASNHTPEEIYRSLINQNHTSLIQHWYDHFESLGSPTKHNWRVNMPDNVGIELMAYKIACEELADSLPEHEEVRKAEITHRYFKTMKLAGALAFIDEQPDMSLIHLEQAMKITEESGEAFQRIFNRERNYVRLAKFIASSGMELTQADLTEELPFYRGSVANKNEMMSLAAGWGYKNHMIIKRSFSEGIELFRGETLEETNLDKIQISYSTHMAFEYRSQQAPFRDLDKLLQLDGYHWINHALKEGDKGKGHRQEDTVIEGFNMIVLDVDNGASIHTARTLLKDYTYLMYTTKRHTDEENRFRVLMPINYRLRLDSEEYKEFMQNVFSWFPIAVDETTGQRSRKWLSHAGGEIYSNEGELVDALKFIPKTSRNETYRKSLMQLESLTNLERWFAQRMEPGNRNNQMVKFALALVDTGMTLVDIERNVLAFNSKLQEPLDLMELKTSVFVTVAKKVMSRDQ